MPTDYERTLWRDHSRRWRAENPDRAREICREYYHRNRDRIREQKREYRQARKAALASTPTATPASTSQDT